MSHDHPIRSLPVNVWQAPEGQSGPRWIAMFGYADAFPIRFSAETEDAVRAKAEAFRDDVLEKHEAAFQARAVALGKARATRAKKGSA